MATAVIMPKFEMAQETGTVARWLKNDGDRVAKGETLLEVETDKVTMEVESPAAGILINISAPAGLVVPIGQPIAYIAAPGEALAPRPPLPTPGEGTTRPSSPLVPRSETGGSASLPSPQVGRRPAGEGGVRATPLAERVASVHGVDLSQVTGTGPQGRVMKEDVEHALEHGAAGPAALWPGGRVRAVPAARRLARELAVDLLQVAGSGPTGRIQSADILAAARAAPAQPSVTAPSPTAPPAAPEPVAAAPAPSGAVSGAPAIRRTVPLSTIRRTIAERMTASVREAPQFSVGVDADMGRAQAVVDDLRETGSGRDGPKITLTAFLVKACAWALAQNPAANASFDPAGHIVEWAEVNVGVATAADQGLLVPVIRCADRLGVRDIAARLADITARAREGRLRLEDVQSGTFTVSNLGMFGIERFTAILNPPQAAILAVGRAVKRPVVGPDDQIKICQMSSLTLTADHRVLDGASAARFLALIQQAIEHPGILLG